MPKYKVDPLTTPVQMAEEMYHRQMAFIMKAIGQVHAPPPAPHTPEEAEALRLLAVLKGEA